MALDMTKYKKFIDTWDGTGNVNEALLSAGGIDGIICRMNDTYGGLKYDVYFKEQWAQATAFGWTPLPYVVISPWWKTAEQYLEWLIPSIPSGCKHLALDVEIPRPGFESQMGVQLATIAAGLVKVGIKPLIYTSAGFLPKLKPWPTQYEYWFARYPYALQWVNGVPSPYHTNWTWEQFWKTVSNFGYYPDPGNVCPGPLVAWQCASNGIYPGSAGHPLDINIMTNENFARLFGTTPVPPVVIPPVVIPPSSNPDVSGIKLMWPCDRVFVIGQRFGENPANYAPFGLPGHEGLDFLTPTGCNVFAMADGIVEEVDQNTTNPYGIHVGLKHQIGNLVVHTIYAHLKMSLVIVGGTVKVGSPIAVSDNTGNSTGPHLHITVKVDGYKTPGYPDGIIDPFPLVVAVVPPVVPPVTPSTDKRKVTASVLTVREKPNSFVETPLGYVKMGDILTVESISGSWGYVNCIQTATSSFKGRGWVNLYYTIKI